MPTFMPGDKVRRKPINALGNRVSVEDQTQMFTVIRETGGVVLVEPGGRSFYVESLVKAHSVKRWR